MESWLLGMWQVFLLGLARVATLLVTSPVLGGRMIPTVVKILTALALTLACLRFPATPVAVEWPVFVLLLAKEVAIGFAMGFGLTLLLTAFQAAGEYMGFQMMFSAGSAFLPLSQEQSTLMGNFLYIFSLLIFVTLDGHHWLIRGLDLSFRTVPVAAMPRSLGPFSAWMTLFGQVFAVGVRLALPLLVALFITNLMLGMIARTMPQINVFIVGMPVQIMAGLLILMVMLGSLTVAETGLFHQWARDYSGLIRAMAPVR